MALSTRRVSGGVEKSGGGGVSGEYGEFTDLGRRFRVGRGTGKGLRRGISEENENLRERV